MRACYAVLAVSWPIVWVPVFSVAPSANADAEADVAEYDAEVAELEAKLAAARAKKEAAARAKAEAAARAKEEKVVQEEAPEALTLKLVKRRARPWKKHLKVEQAWKGSPPGFVLRGLLTQSEIADVIELAKEGMMKHQEGRGNHQATVSLDKAPQLNSSKVMGLVNRRLSALSGIPEENIEEGYFSVYNQGHTMEHMHMDNHHALFTPQRVMSFVIYLLGEPEGLVGGGTVFPLAGSGDEGTEPIISDEYLDKWQEVVASSRTNFQLGSEPQKGRICHKREGEVEDVICDPLISHAQRLCKEAAAKRFDGAAPGGGAVIRAKPGDAIMFSGLSEQGDELVRSIHAGCGLDHGNKIILSKFLRVGPRPWNDEEKFSSALEAWRQRQRQQSKPSSVQWTDEPASGWGGAGGAATGFREDDDEWEEEDDPDGHGGETNENEVGKALDDLDDELELTDGHGDDEINEDWLGKALDDLDDEEEL